MALSYFPVCGKSSHKKGRSPLHESQLTGKLAASLHSEQTQELRIIRRGKESQSNQTTGVDDSSSDLFCLVLFCFLTCFLTVNSPESQQVTPTAAVEQLMGLKVNSRRQMGPLS